MDEVGRDKNDVDHVLTNYAGSRVLKRMVVENEIFEKSFASQLLERIKIDITHWAGKRGSDFVVLALLNDSLTKTQVMMRCYPL